LVMEALGFILMVGIMVIGRGEAITNPSITILIVIVKDG
jgi:hypothetical protein